jgi:hypothetical protein
MAKNNSSGYTGVYWYRATEKWGATIKFNHKSLHLGFFIDISDAISARKAAEIQYGFHPNHGAHP